MIPAGPPPAITQRVCSFSTMDHMDTTDNQSTHYVILSEAKLQRSGPRPRGQDFNLGSLLNQMLRRQIPEMFASLNHDRLCTTGHLRTKLKIILFIRAIR